MPGAGPGCPRPATDETRAKPPKDNGHSPANLPTPPISLHNNTCSITIGTKASAGVVEVARAERQPARVGSSKPGALNQEILQVTDLGDFSFHRLATTTLEIEPFNHWYHFIHKDNNQTKSRTMIRPTAVQARDNYRIWIEFEDGEQGEIDLSHLAGQGVFKAWLEPEFFQDVRIVGNDTILWGNDIDLCPDELYMDLTGKTVDQIWKRSRSGVECFVPFAKRKGTRASAARSQGMPAPFPKRQ